MDRIGPRRFLPGQQRSLVLGRCLFSTGNTNCQRRTIYTRCRRRVCSGRRDLHRNQEFSTITSGHIDRRYADVRHGWRICGSICCWPTYRTGTFLENVLDCHGCYRDFDRRRLLFVLIPKEERTATSGPWFNTTVSAFKTVFKNPQSILCGMIAGLMFIPTTIFDMIWGVRFLQEAHGVDYGTAVMRSATVPFGWIIGCPCLGFISDRLVAENQ